MSNRFDDFITITAVGSTLAAGAASANAAIPNAGDGNKPRYIRVASVAAAFVKLGIAGVAATSNDILVQPADAVILQVPLGVTHFACIQDTVAGKVNVTALEQI